MNDLNTPLTDVEIGEVVNTIPATPTKEPRIPRWYFVPAGDGARIQLRGCSFHMTSQQIRDFVTWLSAGRPDPTESLREARAALVAARAAKRAAAAEA